MKRLQDHQAKILYRYLKNSINPKDMILQLIFETGCRVSEATPLCLGDLEGEFINITGLKGSRNRRVQISENLTHKLMRLDMKPTFMRHVSKTRSLDSARRILTRRFHELTLELLGFRCNLHMLRHTAISRLYLQTKDIILTQTWAGHKSTNSTAVYISLDYEEKANKIMVASLEG